MSGSLLLEAGGVPAHGFYLIRKQNLKNLPSTIICLYEKGRSFHSAPSLLQLRKLTILHCAILWQKRLRITAA